MSPLASQVRSSGDDGSGPGKALEDSLLAHRFATVGQGVM